MPKLANEMRERFCQYYVLSLIAQQAAKDAGYAEKSAHTTANRLLKDELVQKRLAELAGKMLKRYEVEVERIITETAGVAFTNLTDVASWSPLEGLRLKASEDLTQHEKAAVKKIKLTESVFTAKDGSSITKRHYEIEMGDKLKALAMLAVWEQMAGTQGGGGYGATGEDSDNYGAMPVALVPITTPGRVLPAPRRNGDS